MTTERLVLHCIHISLPSLPRIESSVQINIKCLSTAKSRTKVAKRTKVVEAQTGGHVEFEDDHQVPDAAQPPWPAGRVCEEARQGGRADEVGVLEGGPQEC